MYALADTTRMLCGRRRTSNRMSSKRGSKRSKTTETDDKQQKRTTKTDDASSTEYVRVVSIAGKGKGLIATRPIPPGTIVLREPLLIEYYSGDGKDDAPEKADKKNGSATLTVTAKTLTSKDRAYIAMARRVWDRKDLSDLSFEQKHIDSCELPVPAELTARGVSSDEWKRAVAQVRTNSFSVAVADTDSLSKQQQTTNSSAAAGGGTASSQPPPTHRLMMASIGARFNHSCRPNTSVFRVAATNEFVFYTHDQSITTGQELTIGYKYYALWWNNPFRSLLLRSHFDECKCERCGAEVLSDRDKLLAAAPYSASGEIPSNETVEAAIEAWSNRPSERIDISTLTSVLVVCGFIFESARVYTDTLRKVFAPTHSLCFQARWELLRFIQTFHSKHSLPAASKPGASGTGSGGGGSSSAEIDKLHEMILRDQIIALHHILPPLHVSALQHLIEYEERFGLPTTKPATDSDTKSTAARTDPPTSKQPALLQQSSAADRDNSDGDDSSSDAEGDESESIPIGLPDLTPTDGKALLRRLYSHALSFPFFKLLLNNS